VRPPWFIIGRTARPSCRVAPVTSTLGIIMARIRYRPNTVLGSIAALLTLSCTVAFGQSVETLGIQSCIRGAEPSGVICSSTCDPRPEYPKRAARSGRSGTVLLNFTVKKDGSVDQVTVTKSAGHEHEHKSLDRATVEWLGTCTFNPALELPDGKVYQIGMRWMLH